MPTDFPSQCFPRNAARIMDNERQDEESTRDLQLTRWWVPAMAAMLVVNFGLVALAVGRPSAPRPVALVPATKVGPPAPTVTESLTVPIQHVVIAPDVELAPPVPAPPAEPTPAQSTTGETTPSEPATSAEVPPAVDPPYFAEETPVIPPVVSEPVQPQSVESTPAEPMLPAEPTPAPTQPAPAELPRNEVPALVIVNPPQSGGTVHLAVDGVVTTLLPGEYVRLPGADSRRVEYHRGDDFDYAEHELAEGVHQFQVGDAGWTLVLVERDKVTRLLETCRAIAK
jgi:hypothetical protein